MSSFNYVTSPKAVKRKLLDKEKSMSFMNAGGIESGEQVLELKNKSSKKEDVMNYDSDDSLDYDEV